MYKDFFYRKIVDIRRSALRPCAFIRRFRIPGRLCGVLVRRFVAGFDDIIEIEMFRESL